MASFFKNLVGILRPGKGGGEPQVYLGAFGKHPGWDDHADDIGLETERLVNVKRLLYVQGIGANIDGGKWDNLEPDQRLEGFQHALLWYNPTDLVLGRFWSSSDGKGRTKYPMVIAAELAGLSLDWALGTGMEELEKVSERCQAATAASTVVSQIDHGRAALRQAAAQGAEMEAWPLSPQLVAEVANRPEFGRKHEGFFRILYQIDRGMLLYRTGVAATTSRSMVRRSEQLRVPRCDMAVPEAMSFWLRFLLTQLDAATPILVLAPLEQPFLDILVGDPGAAQLVCLRASPKLMPLTSDIPYTLDDMFRGAAGEFLAQCRTATDGIVPLIPRA